MCVHGTCTNVCVYMCIHACIIGYNQQENQELAVFEMVDFTE